MELNSKQWREFQNNTELKFYKYSYHKNCSPLVTALNKKIVFSKIQLSNQRVKKKILRFFLIAA